MPALEVDGLLFHFDEGWLASKYDDWVFYKTRFQAIRPGVKAVDIIAVAARLLYLIEVKDYGRHARENPSELAGDISDKVLWTLAALLPAKLNADAEVEKAIASRATDAVGIRVVLHLAQPLKTSALFPRAIDPANVQLKLRQRLKAIDRYARVRPIQSHGMPWLIE